jgi:hypothetical protein
VPRHAARCHCRRSSRPTASSSIDCSFGPGAVMSAARIASLHHASTGRRPVVTASRKIGGRASACGSSRSCLLVGRERLASTCSGELICDRDDRAGRLRRDARLWRGAESRPPRRSAAFLSARYSTRAVRRRLASERIGAAQLHLVPGGLCVVGARVGVGRFQALRFTGAADVVARAGQRRNPVRIWRADLERAL